MPYRPRILNRVYAWIRGYFWIPCPICKRGFGEHEWESGNELWLTDRDSVAVCPRCAEDAAAQNRENGFPVQERPVDRPPPSIR